MTKRTYLSSFELIALAQMSALDEDPRLSGMLDEITALAEQYKNYGPVTFGGYFDSRDMVDIGNFGCGRAYELTLGSLLVTLTITHATQELIVRDITIGEPGVDDV
jgi:hypothetical protein